MKGAAVGAHIELRSMAAAELLRAAVCQTIAGSTDPIQLEPEAWQIDVSHIFFTLVMNMFFLKKHTTALIGIDAIRHRSMRWTPEKLNIKYFHIQIYCLFTGHSLIGLKVGNETPTAYTGIRDHRNCL